MKRSLLISIVVALTTISLAHAAIKKFDDDTIIVTPSALHQQLIEFARIAEVDAYVYSIDGTPNPFFVGRASAFNQAAEVTP